MAISQWLKGATALVAMAAAVASSAPLHAQEIYKTVDENGNVVYTDQKPSDDAVPVELKELTVVDPVKLGDQNVLSETAEKEQDAEPQALYDPGLTILSPTPGQTIQNTAYVLDVQVDAERELPEGTQLAYLVDGELRATTRSLSVSLEQVFRGEHQVSVELRAPDGRVIAGAGPVTFFMRQHSIQHPDPR